ncbi:hypothetical protein C8T65DRAFT_744446 [Cerioporus squamosus]|nr:hypothetical protein C8T65DRAFT_744446 [Cerioporus squamosus]
MSSQADTIPTFVVTGGLAMHAGGGTSPSIEPTRNEALKLPRFVAPEETSIEPEPDSEEERAIRRGFVVYESDSESSVEPEPDSEEERAIRREDLPGPSSVVLDRHDFDGSTLHDTVAKEYSSFVIDTLHSLPPSSEILTVDSSKPHHI